MKNNILKKNERFDDLQVEGLKIIQNPDFFCFGIDAVLLSHFAKIKENESVIDLCTGTAIVPLLLSSRYKPSEIVAVDIQAEIVDMAKRSIIYNKLEKLIKVKNIDLKDLEKYYKKSTFDVLTVNPPYMQNESAILNKSESQAVSRHEILCTFEDVVKSAAYLLKDKGRMYLVHRTNRLVELINTLSKYKLEAKTIQFVHPKKNKNANIVLIEVVLFGGSELKVIEPLFVYNQKGDYTKELLDIHYRLYEK